ncbi:MAG TPA: ATP-dependent zinc metalloprotease FtsH, partial [Rhodopila sp.]|nr:ATP-dependent zinc metalloprotease FtsH [Rhodopila sp.]
MPDIMPPNGPPSGRPPRNSPPGNRRPGKPSDKPTPGNALRRFGSAIRKGFQLHPEGQKPNKQQVGAHAGYWILAFFALMLLHSWWVADQSVATLKYSDFLTMLRDHKIASVEVEGSHLYGNFKEPDQQGRKLFATTAVPADLQKELQDAGVTYTGVVPNPFWSNLLSWIIPLGLFYAIWAFGVRRAVSNMGMGGGGLMSIGQSRAKIYVETDTKTTFADVAGADEAKEELKEIIDFLKEPVAYGALGAHVPKGVLLVGPPGTGKTLLARAVAGEAGVPFFSISGSEFVEMFVGVGAARVRDLFQQARDRAPAIIFIDELDALGRSRGAFAGLGGHDEKEQTLNQLLVELDGFDPRTGVILLAATNRPEVLDPALLRAGRFDRQVLVDRPDKGARAAILRLHLAKVKAAPDVTPEKIAELTPGMTGADLANVVNEAALLATRRGAQAVEMSDINEAVERTVAGLARRTRVLSPEERETVAYHELGHALVALSLPGTDPVHKVSIIPRGVGALGYTIQRPTEDRFLMSREELENKMAVLLGGRAAEVLVFNRLSTGAADDLQKVTDIARAMVTRFGMIEALGPVVFEREQQSFLNGAMPNADPRRGYSESTAQEIDRLIQKL